MANTTITTLGEQIQCSGGSEVLIPALGDGTSKAGMAVYIANATGRATAVDGDSATAGILFAGILDRHYSVALDTAITADLACNIIFPTSGRIYRVFIEDFGAAGYAGTPMTFGQTTAGSFKKVTTKAATGNITATIALTGNAQDIVIEPVVGHLYKDVANGDTVAYVIWK